MDIDLAGRIDNDPQNAIKVFQEICSADVEADGLAFDPDSVKAEPISVQDEYKGVRVKFAGYLDRARVHMQIDVGIGDDVEPDPQIEQLPVILDFPAPRLFCYPIEAIVAEKFEAMVSLGLANTRLKDFYDLWHISQNNGFSRDVLAVSISKTFKKRLTELSRAPDAFSQEFAQTKEAEWAVFIKRTSVDDCPSGFSEVQTSISAFLSPLINYILDGSELGENWQPGDSWGS